MSARQQLIREYRVPEPLLRRFAGEVEKRVCAKFEERINALERQVADLAEREHIWRQKHFKADKARQDAELLLGVRERVVAELTEKVAKQSAEIAKLREQIYGESSERTMPIPASQDDTAKGTSVGAAGVPSKRKRGKQPGAKGFGRRTEEGLERVVERHTLASHECPLCGLPYDQCPDEKSEEVDIQEKVFIREHYREKARRVCRCPNEKVPRFTLAEAPSKLIPAGKYSTRFWCFVIEEKFLLQRPLNRVIIKLKFMGLKKISAGVLSNGLRIIYESLIFEVMYLAIIDRNRTAGQWNMDDTGWKVFSESSSHWHMWVSVSVDTCVYVLDPERSNKVVGKFLKGVTEGVICADRHSSFKAFANRNDGFVIAFCWAHQRRDFLDMQKGYPELSAWCQGWIDRIDALFHQNKVRVAQLDDPERFNTEDEILRQMVSGMHKETRNQLRRKKLHAEQIARLNSLQGHWSGLTVFMDKPLVPMDNNEAERSLRNLVVGRKNYYGSRAVWSGDLLAQLATIYSTLERSKVDARQWMNDYTSACAANGGNPPKDLTPFYPWNYKPAQPTCQPDVAPPLESLSILLFTQELAKLSPVSAGVSRSFAALVDTC